MILVLPWLTVVTIGGRAIIDRGRYAVLPVVDELRALLPEHRMLILTGAGIRARHVLGVGLDLGLPTRRAREPRERGSGAERPPRRGAAGRRQRLPTSRTAARLISWPCTSPRPGPWSRTRSRPTVCTSSRPWSGRSLAHRSDAGALLLADAYGAQRCVYVKDRDLGTARLTVDEVRERGDSPVDPLVLDLIANAKHVREIQVGQRSHRWRAVGRAVNGKPAGTVISA